MTVTSFRRLDEGGILTFEINSRELGYSCYRSTDNRSGCHCHPLPLQLSWRVIVHPVYSEMNGWRSSCRQMLDKAVPSISFYRYKTNLMVVIKSGILCVEIECIVVLCCMEIEVCLRCGFVVRRQTVNTLWLKVLQR